MRQFVSVPRISTISQTPCSILFITAICLLVASWAAPAHAEQEYMTVTFDDKTIDSPIGTGGPASGEPSWVDAELQAIVRSTPFATRSLEISRLENLGSMGFEMPTAVSEGIVAVVSDVWFYEGSGCDYRLSLRTSTNQIALEMGFFGNGSLYVWDLNGYATSGLTHVTGRSIPILIAIDWSVRTYSVWVDETEIVTDRALFEQLDNVGVIHYEAGGGCAEGNKCSIDQIRVLDYVPDIPVEPTSWGRLRAMYR